MTTTSDPNPMTTKRGAAPLTTVFTTPDFCNSKYWTNTLTPPLSSVVCMPTSWHQLYDYSWGYYSPGICPSGYTEGCAFPTSLAFTSPDGALGLGGPVIAGETPRLCCPTGYTCYTGTSAYSKCISTKPTTTFYDSNNQLTSQLALVYAVQVRWQESDLSILQTNPTVPGATYTAPVSSAGSGTSATAKATATGSAPIATGSTTAAGADAGSSSGDGDSGGDGGGISVGATVGIAVGSVVGTLVLALLGFMIWWRRRRRQEAGGARGDYDRTDGGDAKSDTLALPHKTPSSKASLLDVTSPSTLGTGTTVFGDAPSPHSPAPTQLDSTNVMEMETMERPQELPDDNAVYEMEGDMPGPPLYREKEGWPLR